MERKEVLKTTNTKVIEKGYMKFEITLSGNKLKVVTNHKWFYIENPCDKNGNPLIKLPDNDNDVLDVVMYNEILQTKSPMKVFESYLYAFVNGDGVDRR